MDTFRDLNASLTQSRIFKINLCTLSSGSDKGQDNQPSLRFINEHNLCTVFDPKKRYCKEAARFKCLTEKMCKVMGCEF